MPRPRNSFSFRSLGSGFTRGGTPVASLPSAVFNLMNAILGGGIVALPNAWAESGFILGWVVFIAIAILSCYTLELLIWVADPLCRRGQISVVSYEQVIEAVLGRWGRIAVLVTQFLYAFGIAVGYIVIMKTNLPEVLAAIGAVPSNDAGDVDKLWQVVVIIVLAAVLLLPLSCLRSMSSLSFVSVVSFFCGFMMIVVVAYEIVEDKDALCVPEDPCIHSYTTFAKGSFFSVFGVFVFTKASHHNQFQIYRSLGERANPRRWAVVCRTSIVLVSLITSTCGMITYALFGDKVNGDFFLSFGNAEQIKTMKLVLIGKVVFVVVLAMSFPMQLFVTRETIQVLVADFAESQKVSVATPLVPGSGDGSPERRRISSALDRRPADDRASAAGGAIREATSTCLHYGTTLTLFVLTVGLGLLADSLTTVLSLVGGVAGSLIAFVLPGVLGYLSEDRLDIPPLGGRLGRPLALFTATFGTATAVITTLVTLAPSVFPDSDGDDHAGGNGTAA